MVALTLFVGFGLVHNVPTSGLECAIFFFGFVFWLALYIGLGSLVYRWLGGWKARAAHVAYWALRWVIFLALVASNYPTAVILSTWLEFILVPVYPIVGALVHWQRTRIDRL